MGNIILTRIVTSFMAIVLAAIMLCELWMKSDLATVPLLLVSAFLVYVSIIIACILGERIVKMLNRKH
jgi:hypothetical protein